MLSASTPLKARQPRLLLIDGDSDCCDRLREILGLNAERLICLPSIQALHNLAPENDDIVLLGLTHCGTESLNTLHLLAAQLPTQPILVMAPEIDEQAGQSLLEHGASDFIALNNASVDTLWRAFRYAYQEHLNKAEIHQLRTCDSLTGLGNRRAFYQNNLSLMQQLQQGLCQLALLTIDLEGFSKFNSQQGHSAGDEVILQLKQRLLNHLLPTSTLMRLGGDEFAIMMVCATDDDLHGLARQQVKELLLATSAPYRVNQRNVILPCSIGVAYTTPGDDLELDELMRRSAVARLRAKQERPGTYQIYNPALDTRQNNESDLEPELAFALRANQFELFFQPQIDLRTGQIAGAEALIRWRHPSRGLIMPGEFISLCERNGMIIPIGYWAIHQAGMKLKELQQQGHDDCRISVNLSFRQFQDSNLSQTIQRIIDQNQINSAFLEFELTESALISDEQHVSYCLQELSNMSIDFALDDFGTGYSSFALLQKLPISTLKIDRSFIRNVTDTPNDAEIVRAIINLAHSLDKKVIAEGVETPEQLEFLIRHGCDQVQGYLYSPPVPFKEFVRMLEQA